MRPAAGKRIADEPSTRVSWPLFCIVFLLLKFHATHPKALACCFLYVVTFRSQGFNLIACPNIPVCLKRGVVHFECRDGPENMSSDMKSSAKLILDSSSIPPISWPAMGQEEGGEQTISGNPNLFKVTERVRETDWHWWDQSRTVRCCAALRPGLTSLIDRVWWDCHWARRAAER